MKYTHRTQLEARFPIGTRVINLTSIEAYVVGYVEHTDGSIDLLLAEKRNGKFKRSRWTADPKRCQPA